MFHWSFCCYWNYQINCLKIFTKTWSPEWAVERLISLLITPFMPKYANIADPDQMPQNTASDQGLHCLLTGISIENKKKYTGHPLTGNRLIQ